MRKLRIGHRMVGEGAPVFVIAEAGVNHNGKFGLAKKLVKAAKKAGADAIKFQTFSAEDVVTKDAPQAEYQKKNTQKESQFSMLKKLELSDGEFRRIKEYCGRQKIMFLSTPFSEKSADFLSSISMAAFKISSGELTNLQFIKHVASFGEPIILSTGMATMEEVREAVRAIYLAGNRQLVLLHCTSNYPAALKDANLKAIVALADEFGVVVGYSDHTAGIDIAPAAVAIGAKVIEKHLTLDRDMAGPDHKASIEPHQFAQLVDSIRNVEAALGTGKKQPMASEKDVMRAARRSLIAKKDIAAGSMISRAMIEIKRPGSGIKPKYLKKIVGRKIQKGVKAGELLAWQMFR